MLAYIFNKHGIFPGDVFNRPQGEKLFIYAAATKQQEADETERRQIENQPRKGGRRKHG